VHGRLERFVLGCSLILMLTGWARTSLARQEDSAAEQSQHQASNETSAQDSGLNKDAQPPQPDPGDYDSTLGKHVFGDFVDDQKAIWTSPFHVHLVDAEWLVPLGGAAAAMFATDTEVSKHLSNSPNRISESKNLANYGIASLVAAGGGMYLWGHITHNDHMRETGFLAGEAAVDSLAVTYALKYALGRERPLQGTNYQGNFWSGGVSFPSEHSSAAWSIAGVIAHEYPGPLTSVLSYGLAAAISGSRVTAKQHFPSDVLIGSALGWFIGQEVYRHHHDPTIGGGEWETYAESRDSNRAPASVGSPYVELDSWIYPAFDRLIGMGIIGSAFSGVRPWTRSECARMLDEASDGISASSPEAQRIYSLLEIEFKEDIEAATEVHPYRAKIESVYTRFTDISGEPLSLTSGYTFAQTLINDFGRPYEEGFNSVSGFSGWASAGRWVTYVRTEYQQSPSAPALSESARLTIAKVDPFPGAPPDTPTPAVQQVQLLDAYAGVNVDNWEITFGKQSLWWGPGNGGPMLFGNNAPPINMFRVNRVSPLDLPKFLHWLGPMRVELFLGQLTGYQFILTPAGPVGQYGEFLNPQPIIHGQLISFKPTANFEFAFYKTTIYGGPGYPVTFHTMIRSIFSTGNESAGGASKPGDRRSGLNFSYRLPHLRKWLTLYADGFTDDEITPIRYVNVSAWHAGLYLSHFPHVSRMDLRMEGVYTDVPGGVAANTKFPGSFYQNGTWRSGYTNDGDLIGSWIGRGGQGAQAWSNYWFSPRTRLQLYFRHQKVSQEFLPGGGSLTDAGGRMDLSIRPDLSFSVSVQHERWLFPSIQPNISRNVAAAVGVEFEPQKVFQRY
jgi:hypothetical protein